MKIKKTKGFTLIEILLVTGFISVATVGVYSVFNKARDISLANEEAKVVEHFRNEIARMYENSPSYAGLDNVTVNQAKVTPTNMVGPNPSDIINKYSGNIVIAPITYSGIADSGFRVTYPGIRIASCSHMALSLVGSFNIMTVNGTIVKNYGDDLIDPAILTDACDNTTDAAGATINFDYVSSFLITAAGAIPPSIPRAGTVFKMRATDTVCDIDSQYFGPLPPAPSGPITSNIRNQIIQTFRTSDNHGGRCPTSAQYNAALARLSTDKASNPSMNYQDTYTNVTEPVIIYDNIYVQNKSTQIAEANTFCTNASADVFGGTVVPSSYVIGSGNKCRVN